MIARLTLLIALLLAQPAAAMVGGAAESSDGVGRSVVAIVGSSGNFCSGALIAPRLVLSAAHCVGPGNSYKIVQYHAQKPPELIDTVRVAAHPQFNMAGIVHHRASADVALLLLAAPLPGRVPTPIGAPREPLAAGNAFGVAGIGVTVRGDGRTGGTVRAASLVATGAPGRLQIRLVDPATNNVRDGLGACTGDSGGPAFEQQDSRAVIVGVISWSTSANNAAGCGGLTGVTPLTLVRDWIEQTAKAWGVGR
jgi:hypothetical protein